MTTENENLHREVDELLKSRNELCNLVRMKQFTFYLDDVTKVVVLKKLKALGLDREKGTLSALIRVLLQIFAERALDDPDFDNYVVEQVQKEYTYTTKKNKRGTR